MQIPKYRNNLVSRLSLLPSCQSFTVEGRPGAVYTCYFEAFVRQTFGKLNMPNTGYLPAPSTWGLLPPTRNDTWYRHEVSQGTGSVGCLVVLFVVFKRFCLFKLTMRTAMLMGVWLVMLVCLVICAISQRYCKRGCMGPLQIYSIELLSKCGLPNTITQCHVGRWAGQQMIKPSLIVGGMGHVDP
jgi:hypothetical protein